MKIAHGVIDNDAGIGERPPGSLPIGEGYQCAECGHYFPRNRIRDIDGEYYCRNTMGHNARK